MKKLTYANVTSSIALFLALGGVGYAATSLPTNSVGNAQLRNGSIDAAKIAPSLKAQIAASTGTTGIYMVKIVRTGGTAAYLEDVDWCKTNPPATDECHKGGVGKITAGPQHVRSFKATDNLISVTFDRSMEGCWASSSTEWSSQFGMSGNNSGGLNTENARITGSTVTASPSYSEGWGVRVFTVLCPTK